jgi:hypothetical protein
VEVEGRFSSFFLYREWLDANNFWYLKVSSPSENQSKPKSGMLTIKAKTIALL